MKAGAYSPENFLAYDDFDNTPDTAGRRKIWEYGDDLWKV